MKKSIITFVLMLSFAFSSIGQKPKEYFSKINKNYSELSSMELVLNYQLFKSSIATESVDDYSNTIKISENSSYRKVYTDEIIAKDSIMLVLDHEFKTIQITTNESSDINITDHELKKNLKNCKDILIKEEKDLIQIDLIFENKGSIPYSKATIIIDQDYWIEKIVLYYGTQMNFSRDSFKPELGFPRLEIRYEELKKRWKDKEGITNISKYISLENGMYQPTKLYAGYEIIDLRN